MRKILAIFLITLMALSFIPFRTTKIVEAAANTKATYVLMALQQARLVEKPSPYPYDEAILETPNTNHNDDPYDALRPFTLNVPDNWVTSDVYAKIFATDVYFDVVSDGGLSKVTSKYYVALVNTPNLPNTSGIYNIYIDPDTIFDTPATTNNTQLLGSVDTSATPWTVALDATYVANGLLYGPAKGRFFNIGFSDRKNDGILNEYGDSDYDGDLILFFEDLIASCCGNEIVYDISVVSDVEPAWWLPTGATPDNPKAAAILGPGTGNDFTARRGDLGRSTVPTVQAVTFHNIKLTASQYLDLEVFLDNGIDNNVGTGGTCYADNNFDDYEPLVAGEEFIGAIDNDGLTPLLYGIGYIIDSLSGNKVFVYDADGSNTFTTGDVILSPTKEGWYREFGTVSVSDINLSPIKTLDFVYTAGNVGSINLLGTVFYGPLNKWVIENPVYGLSMSFGDFKGIDINVLPGEMDLDVKIETETGVEVKELKVEQTFNVIVSLPEACKYPPETVVTVYFYLPGFEGATPNKYELIHGPIYLTPSSPTYKFQVTPWRGNWLYASNKYGTPKFKIEAYLDAAPIVGPSDYDCSYVGLWNIKYEDLTLIPDKMCISHLDQRFPNIGFSLYNVNNPLDVDDPFGLITGTDLWAWVDAKGVGIKFLAMAKDENNVQYYVQVNTDGTYYYWNRNNLTIWGKGTGTYSDVNGNGIIDAGDKIGTWVITEYPYHVQIIGGKVSIPVLPPTSGCDEIEFTIFTTEVMYNHVGPRPPSYLNDPGFPGVDYLGKVKVTVTKLYDINFAEFEIVDEGLKDSTLEVSDGVLTNLWWELRSYPGGQSALPGWGWGYDENRLPDYGPINAGTVPGGLAFGFNSRYAIKDLLFWKLGTSYFPLTDYTIRFIAKDKEGNHLSFADGTLKSITIEGIKANSDAQPVFVWRPWKYGNVPGEKVPLYDGPYNYQDYTTQNFPGTDQGLPVYYDTKGKIVIKSGLFENDNYYYDEIWRLNDVQVITGIIPTGPGYLKITITGVVGGKVVSNTYKWCTSCFDNPEGVPVHAIELTGYPSSLTVDTTNSLDITAKVYPNTKGPSTDLGDPPYGENTQVGTQPLASNVVVFVWHDIGVIDPITGKRYGVGDGWITGQPQRWVGGIVEPVYNAKDFNGNKVISYMEGETEIVGKYDLTTYTWSGGFKYLESLTYQIQQGRYTFNLSKEEGALITEVGYDFNSDGILVDNELIPVRITAYQFGDDNSSGGWEAQEVYLAGEVFIPVVGVKDLNVETKPCLTAGVVPELNGSDPLTFVVTDKDGKPVNLSIGIGGKTVADSLIQNYLFRPDDDANNWVRVLLNSTVDKNAWNSTVVATRSFAEKAKGIYKFLGFTANDKGKFLVQVYTPDRKHYGEVEVVVELPHVEWEIVNLEDPNGTVHTVPGDPDFVMTVGDLRFYKVTVTATDCNGNPIGGKAKPAEECKPEVGEYYAGFLPYVAYTPHYFNLVAVSYDEAGRVYSYYEPREPKFGYGFTEFDIFGDTVVDKVPNPPDTGLKTNNAIYNNDYNYDKWNWGQLFPNLYEDRPCPVINLDDTIGLDENGQATFFVITTDIGALSGILGKNLYNSTYGDMNVDGAFKLDWYANADTKVDINFLKFEVLNSETHTELSKDIFNPNYYDLTYGLENHLVVHALPADERDLPVRPGVQVQLVGNVEVWAYGTLDENSMVTLNFRPRGTGTKVAYLAVVNHYGDDFYWWKENARAWNRKFTSPGEPLYWTYDDRAPDFTSNYICYRTISPYGHDLADARELTRISPPVGNASWPLPYFDAGKGLALTLKGDLVVGVETEVTVKIVEAGPNFPVAGVEVTLYGAGVDLSGVTDADGVAKFMVKPTEAGEILVSASKDGYVPGKVVVVVGADTIAPELTVDKPVSPTNKPTVTITGIATDNAGVPMVLVNGVEATVGADGKFSAEVTLKEGENEIVVVAKDKSGNKTEKVVKVVLDTIPPEVTVMVPAGPITSTKVKLTGYVEAGAKVTVNDKPATVTYDDWEVELTLDYGENKITVVATDAVGNTKKVETTVKVFRKTTLELQIGNPTPKVNGAYGDPLEAAPFIKDGRTMVPLRFIAEAFGAQVEWIPETKGINITLNLKSAVHTIGLQVGNPTAIVDGQVVTLDVAPVIVNGRTFVPLRFVAEAFGAKVDWNSLYQVVTIEFLWY